MRIIIIDPDSFNCIIDDISEPNNIVDIRQLPVTPSVNQSSIFHLSPLLEKALRIRAGLFSFMASSLLERPWREKVPGERSEPRFSLVKHHPFGLAKPEGLSNTTPATKKPSESIDFRGFFFFADKFAGKKNIEN